MTVQEFSEFIEALAPRWTAWKRDNVGLQLGDPRKKVSNVLLALEVTPEVVQEAVRRKADLIVAHHPILFQPLKSITTGDETGRILLALAERGIALYAAHTNLDAARGGVSFALADQLGLKNTRFLAPLNDTLVKIAVFVPESHVDAVMTAMADAGGGEIGEYSSCSFRVQGRGTFRGSEASDPYIGKPGVLETVDELRLEMVAPRAALQRIVAAMKNAHPYEEVAYDAYTLENENPNFGMGAVGHLPKPQTLKAFLTAVKKNLRAEGVRYAGDLSASIRRVAVCGGSGSDLLATAVAAGADAFVTADIRYHTFHDAVGCIALIDAGHWETEHVVLEPLAKRLQAAARRRKSNILITTTRRSTNPIHYF